MLEEPGDFLRDATQAPAVELGDECHALGCGGGVCAAALGGKCAGLVRDLLAEALVALRKVHGIEQAQRGGVCGAIDDVDEQPAPVGYNEERWSFHKISGEGTIPMDRVAIRL